VKETEIQGTGLDKFLEGKPKVSKADVQQFIEKNGIKLGEVNFGGAAQEQRLQLTRARDAAYVENNRIWADSLRREPLSTKLFNEMNDGDPEKIIEQMPENVQEAARRFVVTDQLIHNYDAALNKMGNIKATKYMKWTLPGDSTNYTEKLITLPDSGRAQIEALNNRLSEIANRPAAEHAAHPEWKQEWDEIHRQRNALLSKPEFRSSHFEEPNVLAHVRYDERPSIDGKKTLFMEEAQSDWHAQGKRGGYRDGKFGVYNSAAGDAKPLRTFNSPDEANTWAKQESSNRPGQFLHVRPSGMVPDAPFKSDWHELVMKRMLREAAEKGYDRLAWTTGDQQAARYDLSKYVSTVEWHPSQLNPDEGTIFAADKAGNPAFHQLMHKSQVADYIGKETAQKLLDAPTQYSETGRRQWKSVNGLDLQVGGDWAKALYDRAIPRFMNQYAKKWGAKVGTAEIVTGKTTDRLFVGQVPTAAALQDLWKNSYGTLHTSVNNVLSAIQDGKSFADAMDSYGTEQLAEKLGGKMQYGKPRTEKVHSIEITPKMRQSIMKEGQPIAEALPESTEERAA